MAFHGFGTRETRKEGNLQIQLPEYVSSYCPMTGSSSLYGVPCTALRTQISIVGTDRRVCLRSTDNGHRNPCGQALSNNSAFIAEVLLGKVELPSMSVFDAVISCSHKQSPSISGTEWAARRYVDNEQSSIVGSQGLTLVEKEVYGVGLAGRAR